MHSPDINPQKSDENLEIAKSEAISEAIDFDELIDLSVVYKLEYNHPMGNSIAGVYIGIIAGMLDGNVGFSLIFVAGITLVAVMFIESIIVMISAFLSVMGFCYLFSAFIYRDTSIQIDSQGINFPLPFLLSLNGALGRHWTEIKSVRFANFAGNTLEDDKILIGFADNGYVKLNIDGFSRASLKKLILLLNTYRPDLKIKSDFGDLLIDAEDIDEVKNELLEVVSDQPKHRVIDAKTALSFTKIWEAELNSRYGTTAYTPLECGDTLSDGNYKVLGQIAFGGLSAIYLAEDNTDNLVVLKESVLPESADEQTKEKALEMFQREAKLLCTIRHRNISQVYDYFVNDDRHYMVLDHLDGRTVRDFVQEYGRQSEDTALRWGTELASTLSYLHNMEPPVIHRDLTPDNIIIRKDGSISIIDFGAANNFLGTATCTVVGKSAYIPLEQFQGKARLCSDIYAFGATMYFILTGREPQPFSESDVSRDSKRITKEFNQLILECTKVQADERIPTVEILLERLGGLREKVLFE